MSKAENVTLRHIKRVNELLGNFAIRMIQRGQVHDSSKFDPIEAGPLEEMQKLVDAEGQAPFGTDEYKRRTDMLGPMIEHHRAHNSHHPEYYPNGIDGMDLLDLVEMFYDWKAASERGEEDAMNLSFAVKKYNVSPQLESIFLNTATRHGYAVK